MSGPTWTLTCRERPWLLNSERAGGTRGIGGHRGRAELTRQWRATFAGLCRQQHIPPLQYVDIEVLQLCVDRRLPDIGANYPTTKACIDGLVDADVIPDDHGEWIHSLLFRPPQTVGYDALTLRIAGPVLSAELAVQREMALQAKMLRQYQRASRRA